MGPLAGLAAALSACQSDGLVVAACDMPCFDRAAAEFLASFADQGWPAWALRDRAGRLHPLCGVYTKQCLPAIQAALAAGEHRVGRLFQSVGGQAIFLGGDIPARCRGVQREHPGGAKRIAPVLTP